jgi:TetR/AcrR family transcriptional regulator
MTAASVNAMDSDTADEDDRASGTMYRHIARAAARLFASQGYDATSVREIVAAAGVTKPTLYYHFGSKAGLAHALLNAPLSRLTADLRGVLETEPDPVEALRKMIALKFEFGLDDPDRMRFIHALFFGPFGSRLVAELMPYFDELDRVFLAVSQRLAEAGIIAEGFDAEFTRHIRGLVVVSTLDFMFRGEPLDSRRVAGMVQRLIHGFAPSRRASQFQAQRSKAR